MDPAFTLDIGNHHLFVCEVDITMHPFHRHEKTRHGGADFPELHRSVEVQRRRFHVGFHDRAQVEVHEYPPGKVHGRHVRRDTGEVSTHTGKVYLTRRQIQPHIGHRGHVIHPPDERHGNIHRVDDDLEPGGVVRYAGAGHVIQVERGGSDRHVSAAEGDFIQPQIPVGYDGVERRVDINGDELVDFPDDRFHTLDNRQHTARTRR